MSDSRTKKDEIDDITRSSERDHDEFLTMSAASGEGLQDVSMLGSFGRRATTDVKSSTA